MTIDRPDWNFDVPAKGGESLPPLSERGGQGARVVERPTVPSVADDLPADQDTIDASIIESGALTPAEIAEMRGQAPGAGVNLDPDLRETWEKQGGFEKNLERAQGTATRILEASGDADALQAHFDGLPAVIQTKVFDFLRLEPDKRPGSAIDLIAAFEGSLRPAEKEIYRNWVAGLSEGQRAAIIVGIGGGR